MGKQTEENSYSWGLWFHVWVWAAILVTVALIAIGSHLSQLEIPDAANSAEGFGGIAFISLGALAILYDKGKRAAFDGLLVVLEAILISQITGPATGLVAHLGFKSALVDSYLARADSFFGIQVPAISVWCSHHWLGRLVVSSYGWLGRYLAVSLFLPILLGRTSTARKFIAADLIAFYISLPCLYFFPAVGPWFGYHVAPYKGEGEMMIQLALFALRKPGPCVLGLTGILCLPSFHVIWAILCAYTLWNIRGARIPAIVVSASLIIATLATEWHYFVDVIAGLFVALVSIFLARAFVEMTQPAVTNDKQKRQIQDLPTLSVPVES